jgi:hypothetical protein
MTRKRGNPNWSQGYPVSIGPALPTAFELQVRQLRLLPENYVFSNELRRCCQQNRNRSYIPEWLLDTWEFQHKPSTP